VSGRPDGEACPSSIRGFVPSDMLADAGEVREVLRTGRCTAVKRSTSVGGGTARSTARFSSEVVTVRENGNGVVFEQS